MNLKKLDSFSIQSLCANQVILDLASSIKELLENSIDAKSSSIEISLKEYGQESIIVKDNGHGISEDNFDSIMKKGATSKIADFKDLQMIYSYGFRGEALNALNQISDMRIITKTEMDHVGWKLKYNKDSIIESKEEIACETGSKLQKQFKILF
jgi:DNA mismatch repair protein PMS2